METIWSKYFGFNNSKQIWNCIYKQKVITPKIIKIAEFNYKILQNILPCGKVLHKWQHNISDKCNHCGEIETVEHMLFNCSTISIIWQTISKCIKVNVQWKTIVCGFLASEQSSNIEFLNLFISCIAYSIFKYNNREKWNKSSNSMACNMQQYIVRNLKFYCLYFKQRKCRIFDDVRLVKVIESLMEKN